MTDCPVCKKQFDEKTGRRPKRFCSDPCKIKFWNNQKKGADKTVLDATKPSNEVKPIEQSKSNYVIDTESEIEKILNKGVGEIKKANTDLLDLGVSVMKNNDGVVERVDPTSEEGELAIKAARIAELEKELETLGIGRLADQRRTFIKNQILNLKYPKQ